MGNLGWLESTSHHEVPRGSNYDSILQRIALGQNTDCPFLWVLDENAKSSERLGSSLEGVGRADPLFALSLVPTPDLGWVEARAAGSPAAAS